jgi:hypothetical protein
LEGLGTEAKEMKDKKSGFSMTVEVKGEITLWVCSRCFYASTSPFEKCPLCKRKTRIETLCVTINLKGDSNSGAMSPGSESSLSPDLAT